MKHISNWVKFNEDQNNEVENIGDFKRRMIKNCREHIKSGNTAASWSTTMTANGYFNDKTKHLIPEIIQAAKKESND